MRFPFDAGIDGDDLFANNGRTVEGRDGGAFDNTKGGTSMCATYLARFGATYLAHVFVRLPGWNMFGRPDDQGYDSDGMWQMKMCLVKILAD